MIEILVLVEDNCEDVTILLLYPREGQHVRKATDIVDKRALLQGYGVYEFVLLVGHLSNVEYLDQNDKSLIYGSCRSLEENKLMGD
ncbi:hypothetical protein GQ44DRAFT_701238 [Phaeosphaeriaceae sp. PMI808]|nr:hypothetical protein GQ44DRAFT_701238 [Phaeosphaeriaceae sp. PMI808]